MLFKLQKTPNRVDFLERFGMSRKLLDYVLTALETSDDRHQSRYYLINSVGRDARFHVSTFDFALLASFDSPTANRDPQTKSNAIILPRHHKYKYNGQSRIDVFRFTNAARPRAAPVVHSSKHSHIEPLTWHRGRYLSSFFASSAV